ncbi:MAG: T9SS type A sorting domain-containing protein [Ignavibacteriales bacterium]|nr:T9SS type A sorting domain-containing protein [Ignavibacteriales bacterium]
MDERGDIYLFSYLAAEDKSGNGFEVTSLEGGSDELEDPDIYDAAFFRSGFWQNRALSNYIPAGGRMGPRSVSLNGKGRGLISLTASDISDSLATYGPAINFLTPPVTYWYPNVTVKGNLSDAEISNITFYFNDIESTVEVINSEFTVPLILNEGENIVYVKAKDKKNYTSISKNLILTYERDANPRVKIVGSIEGRAVSLSAESSSPDSLAITYYWRGDDRNPVNINVISLNQSINFSIPQTDGEYFFDVRVRDSKGRIALARLQVNAYGDSVYIPQINDHAAWIDDAIFYEIYPRSYSSTGDFNGIKNKIPEMLDLGINAVWLMPIYKGPTLHGYAITDYFDFEEDFGNANDFKALVTAFHNAGIKVVLDFVVNHTSIEHPFMQNVLEYKENSPWANFYIWDGEPGVSNYQYYFDWGTLPNLNHQNKDVRDYFIKAAKYWVSEYDIDGYRCDVAWGVEERNTEFWQEWRNALKNIKPELFLEAEASSGIPVFYQNRFDSANDWDLRNKLIDATNGSVSIDVLDAELRKSYPYYARPFRFVENHDEVRVASSHDANRSKLMHTILMTANGIPLIYSGGEVGELTNRDLIDWGDPDTLRSYFKSLIALRKKYLSNPKLDRIENSLPSDIYSYISRSESNNILTIANFRNESKNVSVYIKDLPEGTKFLTNLIDGSVIDIQPVSGPVFIELNGYEAKVFYLGEEPVGVNIDEVEGVIIEEYRLNQNYPNPFNPVTKISYQIPTPGLVTLRIYDVLGREVRTLVNKELNSGKYEIEFDASSLSSGIYFYSLRAGSFLSTKKLMLLK